MDTDQKVSLWLESNTTEAANPVYHIDPVIVLIVLQLAIYWGFSMGMLRKYTKRIRENFSAVDAICLLLLRNLLIVFLILFGVYAFTFIFSGFFGIYGKAEYFIHLMLAFVIYAMGFKGLSNPEVFTVLRSVLPEEKTGSGVIYIHDIQPVQNTGNEQGKKYKKSSLSDEQAKLILERLFELMEKDKPYLETGLTLSELSEKLSISSHPLSQVINEKLDKSFFDLVNEYRVEEAKQLLVSPLSNRLSVLGIGMESGFNSKSAFYNAFNKVAGITPSKYKVQRMDKGDIAS